MGTFCPGGNEKCFYLFIFIFFNAVQSFPSLLLRLADGALRAHQLFIPHAGAHRPSAVVFGTIKRGKMGDLSGRAAQPGRPVMEKLNNNGPAATSCCCGNEEERLDGQTGWNLIRAFAAKLGNVSMTTASPAGTGLRPPGPRLEKRKENHFSDALANPLVMSRDRWRGYTACFPPPSLFQPC